MTQRFRLISFFTGFALLCLGCLLEQQWFWAGILLAIGIGGGIVIIQRKAGIGWLGLVFFFSAAVLGIFLGLPFWLVLLIALAGLAFWDLDSFFERLQTAAQTGSNKEQFEKLEIAHFRRLGQALAIGWVVAQSGSFVQFRLSLGWAILLGFVVVYFIHQGIRSLSASQMDE
jgi:hypothetical protein